MTDLDVSVVVLTYNGEPHLQRVLEMIGKQEFPGSRETIVIDSGSTDRTLEIIEAFPDVRLIQIPNEEFGHGRTRDLAVRLARGRYVAFLTQDAVPADVDWLSELLAPFSINESVAIVTGRQIPRETAFPLQKYDIVHTFATIGSAAGTVIFSTATSSMTAAESARAVFHSDVNAAVRRDLATTTVPFRDVPYSEDQLMGAEVLDAGFWKAYAGRAAVEHSNDLTLREYGKRMFDETVALRRLGHDYSAVSVLRVVLAIVRGIVGDSLRILFDDDYRAGAKLKWLFVDPFFQIRRWTSVHRAAHVDLDDSRLLTSGSLEHERKRAGGATRQRGETVPDTSN